MHKENAHNGAQAELDSDKPKKVALARERQSLLPESWRVRVPMFEGPLDLLLHLVKINEVEITDIPVALVCNQYHEYLALMEELDLDIAGEYIYEAAVLIQLKSRLLLPQPEGDGADEAPEDPRRDLVSRLLEYQRLKEAAQNMAEVSSVRLGIWTRQPVKPEIRGEEDLDLGDVSLFDLLKVFRRVLDRYDRENPPALVLRSDRFSVRAQLDVLLRLLGNDRQLDLEDHLLALSCRSEAIAAFLAVLELGKLQLIRLEIVDDRIRLLRTTRELDALELENIQA